MAALELGASENAIQGREADLNVELTFRPRRMEDKGQSFELSLTGGTLSVDIEGCAIAQKTRFGMNYRAPSEAHVEKVQETETIRSSLSGKVGGAGRVETGSSKGTLEATGEASKGREKGTVISVDYQRNRERRRVTACGNDSKPMWEIAEPTEPCRLDGTYLGEENLCRLLLDADAVPRVSASFRCSKKDVRTSDYEGFGVFQTTANKERIAQLVVATKLSRDDLDGEIELCAHAIGFEEVVADEEA